MRVIVFAISIIACFVSSALAKSSELGRSEPILHIQEVNLSSEFIEDTPIIQVFLPKNYHLMADHVRYPVIYTLDGWLLSESVSGIVSHLSQSAAIPNVIVVAIHNNKDYEWGPELYASQSGWNIPPNERLDGFSQGYADKHLSYIEHELIPFIDKKFRTSNFRVLIGLSPSAAFALHSFWKAPELFDAHFVFAALDVIGMGYSPSSTIIQKIEESLSENPQRKGYLYVASAKHEVNKNAVLARNIETLRTALKPYTDSNFKLRVESIENYGHYPMAIPALLSALDLVFPSETWDMNWKYEVFLKQSDPVEALLSSFNALSKSIGFEVFPHTDLRRNANCLRVFGYKLRNKGRLDAAERIYQLWIKLSPKDPKAWLGLAQTSEDLGRLSDAISAYTTAKEYALDDAVLYKFIDKRLSSLNSANFKEEGSS